MAQFILLVLCASFSTVHGITYNIYEGISIGTSIGNVLRDASLSQEQHKHGALKFNLLPHGYVHTNLFSVEEDTSELRTAAGIDREDLCGFIAPCILDIVVGVLSQTGNFFQIVPVKVTVQDLNDNAPTFPQPVLKVLIPESALPGMYYNVPTAIDLDMGNNTIQKYELLTDTDLFNLHTSRNSDRTIDISIVLNGTLDREKSAYYQLHVLAKDGGTPPKTGTATINVTVTDVNDHKPQFTESIYRTSYKENISLGETLITVTAIDSDFGENGRVAYYFGLHTNKDTLKAFTIDELSGQIKLKNSLDYETKKQYQFIVGATDHGSQPQTTQTAVVITVEDVNDNAPSLHFNLLSGGGFTELPEDAGPGSFIAHLSVADGDFNNNGKVNCRSATPGFELHRLLANEYKILLNRSLDRESEAEHIIFISCEDKGEPPLVGTGDITVKVSDVNDNAPTFSPAEYSKELYENNKGKEFISQVSAVDSDLGKNSQVSFSLASHLDLFEIETKTGIISAKPGLDREKFPSIELLVVATDYGKTPLSSTVVVNINLLDVNDIVPAFNQKSYHLYVKEEQTPETFVGNVFAEDHDEGLNGRVKYSLLKTPSMDIPFLLNEESGALVTEITLDRESKSTYTFVIAATDEGMHEQLYSMANVTVHVTDINDNFPIFVYPTTTNNSKIIYHTDYVGTLITKVTAVDSDRGENATISYKIVKGNQQNLFQIHPTTGEMFVVNEMSESDIAMHYLSISASDNGQPSKEQITQFNIDVMLGNGTTLPAARSTDDEPVFDNLIIGVTIAITTVLLAVIITIIIIIVKRRKKEPQQFPRAESQHMMAYGDNGFAVAQSNHPISTTVAMPRPGDICRQVNFSLTNESRSSIPSTTFTTFKGENSLSSLDQNSMQPKACSSMLTINARSPGKVETVLTHTSGTESLPGRAILQRRALSPQRVACPQRVASPHKSPNRADSPHGANLPPNMWPTAPNNTTYTIIQAAEAQRLDNHSDLSGEITNSDSGRGGSEEELPNPALKKTIEASPSHTAVSKPKKRVQLVDPVLTEEANINQRIKMWMAKHDPQSAYYQINVDSQGNYPVPCESDMSPTKSTINSSYMPTSILKNSPSHKSYQQPSSLRRVEEIHSPNHNKSAPCNMVTFGHPPNYSQSYPVGGAYGLKAGPDDGSDILTDSLRDDDDGETTTSGSYVINADDLYNEINDLFFNDTQHPVEI